MKIRILKEQVRQIIKEELRRVLRENAGGYYIKAGWPSASFFDPEGNELDDLDGDPGLSGTEIIMATENLPEFTNYVNKEELEAHKDRERGLGREGILLYPDPDMASRYLLGDRDEAWKGLFQLYLTGVLNVPDAKVVEAPEEEEEEDYWGNPWQPDLPDIEGRQ
jgi:hypothetical protein